MEKAEKKEKNINKDVKNKAEKSGDKKNILFIHTDYKKKEKNQEAKLCWKIDNVIKMFKFL